MIRDLTWAGGQHDFDVLKIELLRALQERCDAGPQWIMERLKTKQWYIDDIVSTIRLGLEGGGLDKEEARKLVKLHVEDRPLTLSLFTAYAILADALLGSPDDPLGEALAGTESQTGTRSQEENGASVTYTSGAE